MSTKFLSIALPSALVLLIGSLFLFSHFNPAAVSARKAEANLQQAYRNADNMDYLLSPGLREQDRRDSRKCRTYGC